MNFVLILTVILLCLFALICIKRDNTEVTIVKSRIDGKDYVVQNKPDKFMAADLLAKIKQNMITLLNHCNKQYEKDENIARLYGRFDADAIAEGTEDARYTTYTLNKGEKMVFCLRTRDTDDRIHDENLMTFVAVHEMAHVMTVSEGHTEEFNKNFKFLIQEAVKIGIYKPINYRESPQRYCGINVTDTPLGSETFA